MLGVTNSIFKPGNHLPSSHSYAVGSVRLTSFHVTTWKSSQQQPHPHQPVMYQHDGRASICKASYDDYVRYLTCPLVKFHPKAPFESLVNVLCILYYHISSNMESGDNDTSPSKFSGLSAATGLHHVSWAGASLS